MFLMFRLGRPDVLPELDLGIQNAIRRAYRLRKQPKPKDVLRIGRKWTPACECSELVSVAVARGPKADGRTKKEAGEKAGRQEARHRKESTAEPALVPSSHPAMTSVTQCSRTYTRFSAVAIGQP